MAETLRRRNEVPVEETWDLSLLYPSEEAMQEDMDRLCALADQMAEKWPGKLTDAASITACLDDYRQINEWMSVIGDYVFLAVEVDYYDSANQDRASRVGRIFADLNSRLSFIDSELAAADEEEIRKAMALDGRFRGYLETVLREKPHRLHPEAERVLAAISQTTG